MRHKKVAKRIAVTDKIYNNKIVTKVINRLMSDGKKTVAERIVYSAFDIIKAKNLDPMEVFERAIQTVGPKTEVKARRVGGANYQVPIEVRGDRRQALAVRWIIEAAEKRSSKEFHSFGEKLAAELIEASDGKGDAIKKRDSMLRTAEANRAFSHFRF